MLKERKNVGQNSNLMPTGCKYQFIYRTWYVFVGVRLLLVGFATFGLLQHHSDVVDLGIRDLGHFSTAVTNLGSH